MWLKRNIVMLPSKNGNSKIGLNPNALFNKPHLYYFNEGAVYHECQHLYITLDEEIKEGDWVLLPNNEIHKMSPTDMIHYLASQSKATKKIIATTDTSLGLPQPSQQFIEKYIEEYNKGNVISEVEVEYLLFLEPGNTLNDRKYDKTILKVNSDNTINIKSAKNSWTRDEVIELLHKSLDANIVFNDKFNKIFHEQLDEWIKENL